MGEFLRVVCAACKTAHKVRSDLPPTVRMRCVKCNAEMAMPEPSRRPVAIGQSVLAGTEDDSNVSLELSGQATVPVTAEPGRPAGEAAVAESVQAALAHCGPSDGRYVEQGLIGKGGMGEIVLCIERNTRRQVAMKRMLPTAAQHPQRRARFVEEAQVTAQLEHPNIVPVHELDRAGDGTIYFTMKLVKGRSLAEVIEGLKDGSRPFSLGDLLTIFLKVCDGVAFAHSRGVVHRDLKPANIMVGDFGEVLVMDWGIAKIVGRTDTPASELVVSSGRDSGELHTMAGAAIGTPAYMSPEQAAGRHDEIDARSDIYSLGCILYELLTLQRAVEGLNARAVLDKVINEDAIPPEQRTPERHIPRELSAVTMKCVRKAREDRYQSVGELSRDLKLYLEGRSVSAAPDSFSQAFVKLVKRNKGISTAIAAATIILLAVGAFSYVRIAQERDSAVASELRAVDNEKKAVAERLIAQDERLAAVAARHKERETALAAARRFAMQAIRAAESGRADEAERRAKDADDVALNSPWGAYARAIFASVKHDYQSAAEGFRAALKIDPNHAESAAGLAEATAITGALREAAALVPNLDRVEDWRPLISAGRVLYKGDRLKECLPLLKRGLYLLAKQTGTAIVNRNKILAETQEMHDVAVAKLACEDFAPSLMKLPPDEQIKLVQSKLSEINGKEVQLSNIGIQNGVWIEACIRSQPHVRFLYPLRGLQLQKLSLLDTCVKDLSPLKGMPLKVLQCNCGYSSPGARALRDISPLEGMELVEVELSYSGVEDLTPLRGMKVSALNLGYSPVSDLSPLAGMPLKDFKFTSCMRLTDLSLLKSLPLERVDCSSTHARSLEFLRGCRLVSLDCTNNELTEGLAPLKGMPLEYLNISNSRVSTLEPLRGMRLKHLCLRETLVIDLTALEGMPLETIELTPWKIIKGMDVLRSIKTLRTVKVQCRTYASNPYAVDEFWKRYAQGDFGPPMQNAEWMLATSLEAPQRWRYTTQRPPENWNETNFDSSNWMEGPGGFGNVAMLPAPADSKIRTSWKTADIWLRREFTLPEVSSRRLALVMNNDDAAEVFINGILACTAEQWTAGAYSPYPLLPEARAAVKVGKNILAVHCQNTSGNQYVDVGVIAATIPPTQPATKPAGGVEDHK